MKRSGFFIVSVFSFLLFTAFAAGQAGAQDDATGEPMQGVEIEGVQRIEQETVRSYIRLQKGDALTRDAMNEALKSLYNTGLFADVRMRNDDGVLRVKVVENPVIRQIAFEGNRRLKEEDLNKEIQLRPRAIYTPTRVQQDVERLINLYQKSGRYQANVTPKIISLSQNRVDLVFEVQEGVVTKVQKILFVGNNVYSSKQLRRVVRTESTKWYKFFSSDDTYDPDRLEYDKELLRRYYIQHGYADFQVLTAVAELTPKGDGFIITYTVKEGDRYRFGDVNVTSEVPDIAPEALKGVITAEAGKYYDATKVESSVEALTEELGNRGYAFVNVDPDMKRDESKDILNVTFNIKEGPRVYVERINITGNIRTMDKVIRREFRLQEGDPFSTAGLKRSEQRIRNLGFFEKVDVATEQGSSPDRAVINVNVQEKSTGELTLGAGFSTADGALVDVGVRENNLLGQGKQLKAKMMIATERQDIDVGYTEPYFLNRDISAGVDAFSTQQDLRSESSYDRRAVGGGLRASYAVTENLRHALNYTLREDTVENVTANASRFIRDQEGSYITSSIGHSLTYDKRDNRFDPTEGYLLRLKQDLAGFGGDAKYLRNDVRGAVYYAIVPQWVFEISADAGYIFGVDEDVRINDRFFIGSRQVRGFRNAGLGPRDLDTRDALGGNIYYAGTAELMFPIGISSDTPFRGAVFVDYGSLWEAEGSTGNIGDESSPRVSVGLGLAWGSPMGPVRIDFGQAIVKEEFDETELIRFSFGTQF